MAMARIAPIGLQLAVRLVRDFSEAEGLVRAHAESDLFLLLAERRAAAGAGLQRLEATAHTLADLEEGGEVGQTFSSAVPLVARCVSVVRQQVALLDGSLRESIARLRAVSAELDQNSRVNERVSQELNHLVHSLGNLGGVGLRCALRTRVMCVCSACSREATCSGA